MRRCRGRAAVRRAAVPQRLRGWLFDPRSLTRRLSRTCPGGFAVCLLAQRWQVPLAAERAELGLAPRERALVREVLLTCHGTPWVFARSVFPRASLRGPQRRLARLGTRPLGEVLFAMRGMRRARVRVEPAQPDSPLGARCRRALGEAPRHAWLRSSVFVHRGRALLVSELFLEAFARD